MAEGLSPSLSVGFLSCSLLLLIACISRNDRDHPPPRPPALQPPPQKPAARRPVQRRAQFMLLRAPPNQAPPAARPQTDRPQARTVTCAVHAAPCPAQPTPTCRPAANRPPAGPYSDVQFMRFVLGLKSVACLPLVTAQQRILGVLRLGFEDAWAWDDNEKVRAGLGKRKGRGWEGGAGMGREDGRAPSWWGLLSIWC
jgi:hypothetical protein